MEANGINLGVANLGIRVAVGGRGSAHSGVEFLASAARLDASPTDSYVYFYAVIAGWCILAVLGGFFMVGFAYVGERLGGHAGKLAGISAGVGVATFCTVGMADAAWRSLFVYAAKRRAERYGADDRRVRAAMRSARIRFPALAIQVLVGLVCAALAATLLAR